MKRIVGSDSKHAFHDPSLCNGKNCDSWTLVDCCEAEEDRDVIECTRCGEQRSVKCSFDSDFS